MTWLEFQTAAERLLMPMVVPERLQGIIRAKLHKGRYWEMVAVHKGMKEGAHKEWQHHIREGDTPEKAVRKMEEHLNEHFLVKGGWHAYAVREWEVKKVFEPKEDSLLFWN